MLSASEGEAFGDPIQNLFLSLVVDGQANHIGPLRNRAEHHAAGKQGDDCHDACDEVNCISVTHHWADIVENKRLGEVLTHIKKLQEQPPSPPKIQTNSENRGYQPKPRKKPHRSADFTAQLEHQRELTRAARQVSDG